MIKLENTNIFGWEAAIRGMRNPMNSWDKSDSAIQHGDDYFAITNEAARNISDDFIGEQIAKGLLYDACYVGSNDHKLMMRLATGGSVEAKFRRMIVVTVDTTAPLYWWKEFDTYKVGTVANSCSTMHKIHAKEFTLEDFSCEHLCPSSRDHLENEISILNFYREVYNSFDEKSLDPNWFNSFVAAYDMQTKKDIWWQMIQLLPSSYNQRRTVMLNYEVLVNIYNHRKDHKLDCWRKFCEWIKSLPYSEIITLEEI